jgi:hypothetical protein
MRVAINLLTDDPDHPSGAHWFWTPVIPEMAGRARRGRGAAPARQPAPVDQTGRPSGRESTRLPFDATGGRRSRQRLGNQLT